MVAWICILLVGGLLLILHVSQEPKQEAKPKLTKEERAKAKEKEKNRKAIRKSRGGWSPD